jgi:hypothetical protein
MADPQMKNFAKRLRRIHKIRKKGGAFEASGTVGGSVYTSTERKRRIPLVMPMLKVVVLFTVFKAMIVANHGLDGYQARLEVLKEGNTVQQASVLVMRADPVTELLAIWMRPVIG